MAPEQHCAAQGFYPYVPASIVTRTVGALGAALAPNAVQHVLFRCFNVQLR